MTHLRRKQSRLRAWTIVLLISGLSLAGPVAKGQGRARGRADASSSAAQTSAQNRSTQNRNPSRTPRPRLVLLIAVDQFRYDYLERFGDLFVENGLRRLMRDGASWTEGNYDHTPTYTAPGHATLMTGAWPAETGIVGNEWPDRETGRRVTSVSDETVRLLDGLEGEPGASPRRLMASTVGDELRLATNDRSKVIGISLKDRAAILPAGRHASAAYWFSTWSGRIVSSNYYFNQLPAWVKSFNDTRPADKYFGARWERLLPEAEYLKRAGADAPLWETVKDVAGDTNTFPHTVTGGASSPGRDFYWALDYSPFSNDLLLSFAEQAIVNEKLGDDEDADVLTLSFSANDYVGHRFGPYSQEAMDVTLRVDRQIAALLDFVDQRVGLQNVVVVFTADHGVAPIPEHANALGLPGGRVQNADVLRAIHLAISARYNPKNQTPDPTADYIYQYKDGDKLREAFYNANLYFNTIALKRDGVSQEEIERIAGEAAMTVPGISRVFTRMQLAARSLSPADPLARRVLHGFYPRRSGDLVVVYEPFKYLVDAWSWVTATHGSPYSYDTHVPVIIMSKRLLPGRYNQAAAPSDIAPTLASILRIQSPSNTVGRVLTEAFAEREAQR
ncbi:MAG TPA: alkaline phosphatase family protein [Pyrinomonadaceae bacterium]|jgi:arylsulfatase A-like enzyme